MPCAYFNTAPRLLLGTLFVKWHKHGAGFLTRVIAGRQPFNPRGGVCQQEIPGVCQLQPRGDAQPLPSRFVTSPAITLRALLIASNGNVVALFSCRTSLCRDILLQLRYARQMEKAGKVKVASYPPFRVRNVCMDAADDRPNADDLHRAGARLHAVRSRRTRRPRDLAVHGGAAVLQVSS